MGGICNFFWGLLKIGFCFIVGVVVLNVLFCAWLTTILFCGLGC